MASGGFALCSSCRFSAEVLIGAVMSGVTFYSLACPTCRDVIVGSVDPAVPASQLDLSCPACWGETENLPDLTRSGLCPLCLQRTLQVICGTCVD